MKISLYICQKEHEMLSNTLSQFRFIALLEGISFLLLLGICMPLKYMAGIPQPVSVVGMIHGVLFVAYIAWLAMCIKEYKWRLSEIFWSLLASILPFGTFVADKSIFARYA